MAHRGTYILRGNLAAAVAAIENGLGEMDENKNL